MRLVKALAMPCEVNLGARVRTRRPTYCVDSSLTGAALLECRPPVGEAREVLRYH